MPSDKPKLGQRYPAYWHNCLRWLAERPGGGEILIAEGTAQQPTSRNSGQGTNDPHKHAQTEQRKLRTMRKSIQEGAHNGWTVGVVKMVCDGELHFEVRGVQVWAIRRPRVLTVGELTQKILNRNGMA